MQKAGRLAVVAALALAGCGDDEARTITTTGTPRPVVTPFPTVDFAELEPGRQYTTRAFQPNFTITLPEGEWKALSADKADHVEIEPETELPIQDSGIGFHHMTKVFDPVEGGEQAGDAVDGPADFAAWLTEHPHLKTTKPEPVEAMGLKGVSVDVRGAKGRQKRQYKDCGKLEGSACAVLFVGGIEPIVLGEKSYSRYLVLEQPGGGQLVVEVWAEPVKEAEAEIDRLQAILDDVALTG